MALIRGGGGIPPLDIIVLIWLWAITYAALSIVFDFWKRYSAAFNLFSAILLLPREIFRFFKGSEVLKISSRFAVGEDQGATSRGDIQKRNKPHIRETLRKSSAICLRTTKWPYYFLNGETLYNN
jgi:hypothetical protein